MKSLIHSIHNLYLIGLPILLSAISTSAQAQHKKDSTTIYSIGFGGFYGNIITESSRVKTLAQAHPFMLQADFSFIKNTQQAWNQCGCYTKTGIAVSYVNFNNNRKLGKSVSLAPFIEPILFHSPRIILSLRGSAGFTYLNKVYDVDTNPENLFFSSPISFILSLGLNASYKLSNTTRLNLSAQFNHISNGGTRNPNYGINFPMVGIGASYQLHTQDLMKRKATEPVTHPLKLMAHAIVGRHLENNTKRMVMAVNVGLIKQVSRVNGFGIGGEVSYDPIYDVLQQQRNKPYNSWLTSISLQHYFFYGKLLFGQQFAFNVIPPNSDSNKKFNQRYILAYEVAKNWYGGISLKAHGGISDYLSLSITRVVVVKKSGP